MFSYVSDDLEFDSNEKNDQIFENNFASTFSAVIGYPVPFDNTGTLLSSLLPFKKFKKLHPKAFQNTNAAKEEIVAEKTKKAERAERISLLALANTLQLFRFAQGKSPKLLSKYGFRMARVEAMFLAAQEEHLRLMETIGSVDDNFTDKKRERFLKDSFGALAIKYKSVGKSLNELMQEFYESVDYGTMVLAMVVFGFAIFFSVRLVVYPISFYIIIINRRHSFRFLGVFKVFKI